MRLHILGYPFSELTHEWEHCAFTSRTRTFATMMYHQGYEVITYAGENNEAEVTENVPLLSAVERKEFWPDYEPKRDVFSDFDPNSPGWRVFNARAVAEIYKRAERNDILCLTMGFAHKPVAECFPNFFHVETGIGYSGVWASYRVFESWAWRNFLAAKDVKDDVRAFDEVIPRSYETDDFPVGYGDGGYLLFIGRCMARKGIQIAAEVARVTGIPLMVAGQGIVDTQPGKLTCFEGTVVEGDVTYVGLLDKDARAAAMGSATATLTPTLYFEPFGGVSVESQLTGTPAICTDWAGLRENVMEGQTGFLCSMLREFVQAVEEAPGLDRGYIREHAQETWSIEAVGARFDIYFRKLLTLPKDGWYTLPDEIRDPPQPAG